MWSPELHAYLVMQQSQVLVGEPSVEDDVPRQCVKQLLQLPRHDVGPHDVHDKAAAQLGRESSQDCAALYDKSMGGEGGSVDVP